MRMRTSPEVFRKTNQLEDLAMEYETGVLDLPREGYLEEFYRFYGLKNRMQKLVPSGMDFRETLAEVSGEGRGEPIAEKAEHLFGRPVRAMVFEDSRPVVSELEGTGGQGPGPFFFIFDLMFCEFEECTICFISGTNN